VAGVALNGWAALRLGPGRALAELGRFDRRGVARGLLGTAVYQLGYVSGLKLAPPAEANLLNYLWPLFTCLLAVPLRGERLTGRLGLALGCGLLGVAVLVGGREGAGAEADAYPLRHVGYGGAVLAALSWGLYSNLVGRLQLDSVTSQRAFVLLGAAVFLVVGIASGSPLGPLDVRAALVILYAGLGPVAVAVVLWQVAMRRGPVQQIATASYLTPALSTLWLGLLVGAPVTLRIVLGLALVLGAALLPALRRLSSTR
jgi:drug/metabolite transporter (DMT)-like permease